MYHLREPTGAPPKEVLPDGFVLPSPFAQAATPQATSSAQPAEFCGTWEKGYPGMEINQQVIYPDMRQQNQDRNDIICDFLHDKAVQKC